MRGLLVYTLLRVAVLAAAWLLVQLLTPLRGLLAVAVALVISGIASLLLLRGSRGEAGSALAGVFRRIDERIDRSTRAEDGVEDSATEVAQRGDSADPTPTRHEPPQQGSGETDAQAEEQAVGQGERPGGLENGDQVGTDRTP